ncbi:MAG: hypothetical protein HZA22_01360 [Nitrospirae bacterium]|nr:hypothetical protein [Nitrospirota bacterium]
MRSIADELRNRFDKCIKSLEPDDLGEALFVVEDIDDSDDKSKTIAKNLICKAEHVVVNKLGNLNNCDLNEIHKLLVYSDKLTKFINNSMLPGLPAASDIESKQIEAIRGLIDSDKWGTYIFSSLIQSKSGGRWLTLDQIKNLSDSERVTVRSETVDMFIRIYKEELVNDPSWFENIVSKAEKLSIERMQSVLRDCIKIGVKDEDMLNCGATKNDIERAKRELAKEPE